MSDVLDLEVSRFSRASKYTDTALLDAIGSAEASNQGAETNR